MDNYVDKYFQSISETQKDKLKKFGYMAKCPGFFVKVHEYVQELKTSNEIARIDAEVSFSVDQNDRLRGLAIEFHKRWTEFEDMETSEYLLFKIN